MDTPVLILLITANILLVLILVKLLFTKKQGMTREMQDWLDVRFTAQSKEMERRLSMQSEAMDNKLSRMRTELSQTNLEATKALGANLQRSVGYMGHQMTDSQTRQLQLLEQRLKTLESGNEQKLDAMRVALNANMEAIRTENNKKLDEIRHTVDEQLQTSLEKRLHESFETVSKQLEQVYKGLGEMQNLAADVGGLKQVPADKVERVVEVMREAGLTSICHFVGEVTKDDTLTIKANDAEVAKLARVDLQKAWTEVSWQIARGRDNPACADSEFARIERAEDTGLFAKTTFDVNEDIVAPMINTGARPKLAVLREQGVNSQTEMAAAFTRAGFDAYDVHMTDLLTGRADLAEFVGLACAGGFSYGDVLGAGGGWAKTILHNDRMIEMFRTFFNREDTFGLGICNGCQMMSRLRDLIPGASHWPDFVRNNSEQFEARLVNVEILESPSIFFQGMAGSVMPIVNSHGEGRVQFLRPEDAALVKMAARYVDPTGAATEVYPYNPNGSKGGLTSVTTEDGRFTIMMPHPERSHRAQQLSWHPAEWTDASGWMRMFRNARRWVG